MDNFATLNPLRDACRKWYIENENPSCPIEELLKPYQEAKTNLSKLFPENTTIISKPFSANKFPSDIESDLIKNGLREHPFYITLQNLFSSHWKTAPIYYTGNIAKNIFEAAEDLTITLPDNSTYVIKKGIKMMRLYSKLVDLFNLDRASFEDFRLFHSRILNQAKFHGNLCLSIEPLDYFTMSINRANWSSCMRLDDGEYRAGPIEMMNSPCVIMAYLSSTDDVDYYWGKWNNKKWRELFIVDETAIIGIKGYPYWDRSLESEALSWIASLVEEKFHWGPYSRTVSSAIEEKFCFFTFDENHKYTFKTNLMYNDFSYEHHALLNPQAPTEGIKRIYYSGFSECMNCGQGEIQDASSIQCEDCSPSIRCECCGNVLYDDETYYDKDGNTYCEDCYWERYSRCGDCDCEMPREDSVTIDLFAADKTYLSSVTLCWHCANKYISCEPGDSFEWTIGEDVTYEDWQEMTGESLYWYRNKKGV